MNIINLQNAEKNEFHSGYNINDLFLDDNHYDDWFLSTLEANEKVPSMHPLEGDEEVKRKKIIKNLNFKQTITQTSNIISTIQC